MNQNNPSTKIAGAPQVVILPSRVTITQSKVAGLWMVGFPLFFSLLLAAPNWGKISKDPASFVAGELAKLPWFGFIPIGIGTLLFTCLFLYGVFWLLWTRQLTIINATKSAVFKTGIWPWLRVVKNSCNEVKTIELRCQQMPHRSGVAGQSGDSQYHGKMESWQLFLHLPNVREPFFLGQWGDRNEAEEEIAGWGRYFKNLTTQIS